MAGLMDEHLERYVERVSAPEPDPLRQLTLDCQAVRPNDWGMLSGHLSGRFLALLTAWGQAKRVLEIGTFHGYAALCFAEALPEDGKVITCEVDAETGAFAQGQFDQHPHGHKVTLRVGPALDTLATLQDPFDLAFIDADKLNYPRYVEEVVPLLRVGGLLIIDNALWGGRVVKPDDEHTQAIDQANRMLHDDPRLVNVLVPLRDGLHLARRVR